MITDAYRRAAKSIPGWFHPIDQTLFDLILDYQAAADIRGDILEIGSYHGKSAIALGYGLREDETLHVCDLFGTKVDGVPDEGCAAYEGLTVEAFLDQYGRFHDRRPEVNAMPSSVLDLGDRWFRFAHIDGGHAYSVVRDDIHKTVRNMSGGGVVVLDDYRSAHTPGVSAAAWEAVTNGVLFPFMLSDVKMYAAATPEGQQSWRDIARDFPVAREEHEIHSVDVVRAWL